MNNKKLAKNTLMLYFRTFLLMVVSFYTIRVLITTLGVDDYGIYNLVGGVVISLGVINASLSGASSRYISYAIGTNDLELLTGYYSTIKLIHYLLAILVFVFGETIGLWLVVKELVIPAERVLPAVICYQCCLFTSMVSIVSVPYNSLIMSYERMEAYAYLSILEVMLKLVIIFMLPYLPIDKLICYGVLMLIVQIIVRFIFNIYCLRLFEVAKIRVSYNKKVFREIFVFASWTFSGQLAYIGYTQGLSILLNMFFGPIVNAAGGIANQVQNGTSILSKNFQIAVRPQIIKAWAESNLNKMHRLIILTTKFSYLLTAITIFPILSFTEPILKLWLSDVPEHCVAFVNITLLGMLIGSLNNALIVAIHATGDLKRFQIYESLTLFLIMPIGFIQLYFFSMSAESVMIQSLIVQIFAQIVRMYIVLPKIKLSLCKYTSEVFPRLCIMTIFIGGPVWVVNKYVIGSFYMLFLGIILMLLYDILLIYVIGFSKAERAVIMSVVKSKIFNR